MSDPKKPKLEIGIEVDKKGDAETLKILKGTKSEIKGISQEAKEATKSLKEMKSALDSVKSTMGGGRNTTGAGGPLNNGNRGTPGIKFPSPPGVDSSRFSSNSFWERNKGNIGNWGAAGIQIGTSAMYLGKSIVNGFDSYQGQYSRLMAAQGLKQDFSLGAFNRDFSQVTAERLIMSDPNRRDAYLNARNPHLRKADAYLTAGSNIGTSMIGIGMMGAGGVLAATGAGLPLAGYLASTGSKFIHPTEVAEGMGMVMDPKVRKAYMEKKGLELQRAQRDEFIKSRPEDFAALGVYSGMLPGQVSSERTLRGLSGRRMEREYGSLMDRTNAVQNQFLNGQGDTKFDIQETQSAMLGVARYSTGNKGISNANSALKLQIAGFDPIASAQLVGTFANGSDKMAQKIGTQLSRASNVDSNVGNQIMSYLSNNFFSQTFGKIGDSLLRTATAGGGGMDPYKLQSNIGASQALQGMNTKDQHSTAYGLALDIETTAKYGGGDPQVAVALNNLRKSPDYWTSIEKMKTDPNWAPPSLVDLLGAPKARTLFEHQKDKLSLGDLATRIVAKRGSALYNRQMKVAREFRKGERSDEDIASTNGLGILELLEGPGGSSSTTARSALDLLKNRGNGTTGTQVEKADAASIANQNAIGATNAEQQKSINTAMDLLSGSTDKISNNVYVLSEDLTLLGKIIEAILNDPQVKKFTSTAPKTQSTVDDR